MVKSTKGKPASRKKKDAEVIEHHHIDEMHHRMAIAGAALVFVFVLLFAFSGIAQRNTPLASTDQVVYIEHETCPSCAELQPSIREAAGMLGIPFTAANYYKQVPYPGYALIYNDVLYIAGVQSERDLWNGLCDATQHASVCSRTSTHNAIEGQVP